MSETTSEGFVVLCGNCGHTITFDKHPEADQPCLHCMSLEREVIPYIRCDRCGGGGVDGADEDGFLLTCVPCGGVGVLMEDKHA